MSVFARIAALSECNTVEETLAATAALVRDFGYTVLAIGELPGASSDRLPLFFYSTWPDWWHDTYVNAGLAGEDPIVLIARRQTRPFAWCDIESDIERWQLRRSDLELFKLMRRSGWAGGYAVPVHGPGGYVGLASFAGEANSPDAEHRATMQVIGHQAHDKLRELHDKRHGDPAQMLIAHYGLSERELSVLAGLANGSADRAIGRQLGLSERTVMHYAQTARRKLGCKTRLQAVSLAVKLRIIAL